MFPQILGIHPVLREDVIHPVLQENTYSSAGEGCDTPSAMGEGCVLRENTYSSAGEGCDTPVLWEKDVCYGRRM